jgi:hypothetical protein
MLGQDGVYEHRGMANQSSHSDAGRHRTMGWGHCIIRVLRAGGQLSF